jgi:site-specific recombinase XerD
LPSPPSSSSRCWRTGPVRDEERTARGYWDDHGLVFCSEVGTPLDPSNVRKVFARVAARAGIEGAVPYSLRPTAASLLIDQGVGIEVVADLLGDDPRTLYRHYRHRVRPVVEAAAGPMQTLLGD